MRVLYRTKPYAKFCEKGNIGKYHEHHFKNKCWKLSKLSVTMYSVVKSICSDGFAKEHMQNWDFHK
jgi:hypothetical protein